MAKLMRSAMQLVAFSLVFSGAFQARADDVKDDVRKDGHDVKEKVNKAGHRIDEAGCTGTKAECAAKKGKHRVQETKEKVGDKVDEVTHQ
jgi:hypothetical protein